MFLDLLDEPGGRVRDTFLPGVLPGQGIEFRVGAGQNGRVARLGQIQGGFESGAGIAPDQNVRLTGIFWVRMGLARLAWETA